MKILYRLYYFVRKLLFPGGFVLLFATTIHGQSLCENASPSGFEFDGPSSGCGPITIKVKNTSGLNNVQYHFYYNGESLNEVLNSGLLTSITSNPYFAEDENTIYTILQYGKDDNGNDFYSCKNVTVRANNKPVFSYSSCNGNRINVTIPLLPQNNFDSYQIDWGDGTLDFGSSLPLEKSHSFNDQQSERPITVKGLFSDNSVNCATEVVVNVEMTEGGNYPNIDSLYLIEDEQKIELVFDGLDTDHRIFRRVPPNSYNNNQAETTIVPGISALEYQNVDTQMCFATFRNSGGCFESSGEVCTTPLEFMEITRDAAVLNWVLHPTGLNTLFGSNGETQNVTYNLLREENGVVSKIENILPPFSDDIECTKNYCYQLETIVSGIPKFGASIGYSSVSISNKICTDLDEIKPPAITDLYITHNDDESKSIYFNDNSVWPIEREKYMLVKSGERIALDSISTDQNIFSVVNDENCFSVFFRDQCHNLSENSPEVCIVELSANGEALNWTNNSPFAKEEVVGYSLFSQNEQTLNLELINSFPSGKYEHSPNLEMFENSAAYKLKVISQSGLESFSNQVSIPISTNLYFPTAFSPNGDQINDTFEIKGNLSSLSSFELFIYDRLAHEVFRSTDPEDIWDGTFNGSPLPSGTYQYTLKATNKQNEKIHKHGYMVLLR